MKFLSGTKHKEMDFYIFCLFNGEISGKFVCENPMVLRCDCNEPEG